MFHVRRRPSDFHPRKRKKKPPTRRNDETDKGYRGSYDGQLEPLMIELLPGKQAGNSFPFPFYCLSPFDLPCSNSLSGAMRLAIGSFQLLKHSVPLNNSFSINSSCLVKGKGKRIYSTYGMFT